MKMTDKYSKIVKILLLIANPLIKPERTRVAELR